MPVLILQALRVRFLLAIALFVRIVTAKVVVLASLDPGPRRGANRRVCHRLTINHYLRWQRRFQRGSFQVHGRDGARSSSGTGPVSKSGAGTGLSGRHSAEIAHMGGG